VATANAVRYADATPVFLDIDSLELPHIALEDAEKKRTNMTRAIIVMHYAGYVAEIARWRTYADTHGLYLVEDAAHAPAVGQVGLWSDAAAFSFFSNKNMTTAEGGMVLARDPEVLERVRHLRSHGMTASTLDRDRGHAFSYDVTALGYNYRMDELRAAMGIAQLEYLPRWTEYRRELTGIYRRSLPKYIPEITFPFSADHETAAHLMPILLPKGLDRQKVMEALRRAGIQSSIHYPPVHQFTYYQKDFPAISLPNTEQFYARELSLPLHPGLSEEQVTRVVKTLRQAISHAS
jgi:dTDP-4-amino-4,6-dideoxygalactose transaminase